MSTSTPIHTSVHPPAPSAPSARPAYQVTGLRVLRSEWAKLWSVRSTWITLGVGFVFLVGLGSVSAVRYASAFNSGQPLDAELAQETAVSLALFGIPFVQLALGVLGVLVAAGEYSTGSIRSTLAAVPRRLPVLWSKAAVYGVVALVVGTVGAFISFLVSSGVVAGTDAALTLADPGVVRSLLGAGLYLALVGVISVALGALLRSVASGISVLVVVLGVLPSLMGLLPIDWQATIGPYIPGNAGEALYVLHHDATLLSPTAGLMVFLGWTVLALAGAAYRLVRTDA